MDPFFFQFFSTVSGSESTRHALPKASPCLTVVSLYYPNKPVFFSFFLQTTSRGPSYNRPHTVAVFTRPLCCEAWLRCGPLLLGQHGHGFAASPLNSGIAARLLHRTSPGYAAPPQLWSTSGDLAAACWTGLTRVNGFSAGSRFSRAVHTRGRHHLARYTHQLTCPPS